VSEPEPRSPQAAGVALARSSALVTGGAGFIGSHLVDELLAAGVSRIHVLDDLSLGSQANLAGALARPEVELTVGDAADAEGLERIGTEEGPFDLCYNLAVIPLPHSLERPRENVDHNVTMTTAVCELGRSGAYRRLVQFSSSEVYGTALTVPMDERHPLHPHTPYAAAKAATDLVALSYATTFELDVVVVRPFNTYGERQNDGAYAGLIPAVVRAVLADEPVTIHGDGEQTRDMAYVLDTVQGTLAAAVAPDVLGQTFNLGAGAEVSVNELVRLLLEAMGRPEHPIVHGPPRPGDVRRLLADTRHAGERLGHLPSTPLEVGLGRTVDWYLERAAAHHQ
jgi:UDP-glucose 4-epimerase